MVLKIQAVKVERTNKTEKPFSLQDDEKIDMTDTNYNIEKSWLKDKSNNILTIPNDRSENLLEAFNLNNPYFSWKTIPNNNS